MKWKEKEEDSLSPSTFTLPITELTSEQTNSERSRTTTKTPFSNPPPFTKASIGKTLVLPMLSPNLLKHPKLSKLFSSSSSSTPNKPP